MMKKLLPITSIAILAALLLGTPVRAQGGKKPAASSGAVQQIFVYDANASLDVLSATQISALAIQGVRYKRPGSTISRKLDLYRFHSIDLHETPASVRVSAELRGRLGHAAADEQARAYKKVLADLEEDLGSAPNAMTKAVTALEIARLHLQWAGISPAEERRSHAESGLAALAEILADAKSWFFIAASDVAVSLDLMKDDGKAAVEAAKALVDAADALGDAGRLLVVEARLLLARAAVAAKAGATARDAAAEGFKKAQSNAKWFDQRTDTWAPPIKERLDILARRCRVWEGFGILAQDRVRDARTHFEKILNEFPAIPAPREQLNKAQSGGLSRLVSATDYAKGIWYGSELWAGASLGRAECLFKEAKSSNRKLRAAMQLFIEVVAVAPEMPELLPRAKFRLGECIEALRPDKAGKEMAKSYYQDVIRNHPTSSWAILARSK